MPGYPLFRRALLALSTLAALGGGGAAWAQAAPTGLGSPIPLAEFFKRPQYTAMVGSPNGRYLATTSPLHGRQNLVVIDLQERKGAALTNYDNIDVGNIRWVGDDYLLFSAQQIGAPTGQDTPRAGGLFSVAMDGSGITRLVKTASQFAKSGLAGGGFADMRMKGRVPDTKDEIYAEALLATDNSYDLYRVNVATGKYRLLTQGRPADFVQRWILDSKHVPRALVAAVSESSLDAKVLYRASADAPWKEISRFNVTKGPATIPIGFDKDDKTLFVASNEGRKNMAIYRFDPETGKRGEQVAQHPQYDLGYAPNGEAVGGMIFDPKSEELIGISIDADKPQVVWLDPGMAQVQAMLDATMPGKTNRVQRTRDPNRFIVASFNSTSPGRYYVFDNSKKALEEIGPARPWLEGKLAEVRPFMLKTRDGLEIPSYYILPKGYQPGTRLPTIIHVHGGPHARDIVQGGLYGGFGTREGQMLASRGYAVVLPNFRITPQLGSDIYYAGFGSFGRKMSDDHDDAVQWAVAQGFADPKKVCISGASYGGYAALQNVSRPGHPYACAISGLPVTDMEWQLKNFDGADSKAGIAYWKAIVGFSDYSEPIVKEISPLFNADKIKVPVFLYVGEEDVRTPPKQTERMAEALTKAGNPPKGYYVGKDEGHGYGVEKHNIELSEQILKFLKDVFGQ